MIFSSFIFPRVNRTFLCTSEENKKQMHSESHVGIELEQDNKSPTKSYKFGKVVVGITIGTAVGIVLITVPFVKPALEKRLAFLRGSDKETSC